MDIYGTLGIVPIINAAGSLTRMSGSLMPPSVTDAMAAASRSFVDMEELHLAAGARIAELIGAEAAHVCACAAAGITLMAAASMTGTDRDRISRLPDTSGMRSRFVVQRAHRNGFDRGVPIAGGQFVEVGAGPEEIGGAIDGDTAAIFYTHAWFCTAEAMPLAQTAEIAHRAGLPLIVDAAAEVPPVDNLTRFLDEGADLVTFSGGKSIRGPQSTGFILGKKDLIEACRLNDCPHGAIGRGMKTGKEDIVGLVKAIEIYMAQDHKAEMAVWERRVAHVVDAMAGLAHVRARRQMPYGIGQQIPHAAIGWDEDALGVSAEDAVRLLRDGRPRIAVQLINPQRYGFGGYEQTEIRIHPHTLQAGEEIVIARRLREVFGV